MTIGASASVPSINPPVPYVLRSLRTMKRSPVCRAPPFHEDGGERRNGRGLPSPPPGTASRPRTFQNSPAIASRSFASMNSRPG